MNYNYFIEDKCLFGSYPSSEKDITDLIDLGVILFINLVSKEEKSTLKDYKNIINKYKGEKNIEYINFPIPDNKYPNNAYDFYKLIHYISNRIKYINIRNNEKVYIHCKGGHGRSGMTACFILCLLYNITPEISIKYITDCHKNRVNLKKKWINSKCPNSKRQRFFIFKSFVKISINNDKENNLYGLNISSEYPIRINNKVFQNAEQAFRKTLENIEEEKGEKGETDYESELKYILVQKFNQNKDLIYTLIKTGLKPIIYDVCLQIHDKNKIIRVGKLLEEIRREYYNLNNISFTKQLG